MTQDMYQIIEELNRKDGITVIMVTHDIAAAMKEQYTSLYQDTIIDLSAEMEVMTCSARRDGLL